MSALATGPVAVNDLGVGVVFSTKMAAKLELEALSPVPWTQIGV
jgi:hypothetical protein